MWELGGETHPAYQAELKFDRLRYRLLPYIYSLAGAVTHEGGTIMRPLVMDFRGDATAREVERRVHVRPGVPGEPGDDLQGAQPSRSTCRTAASWYDFWTGADARGRTDHRRARALRRHAGARARRLHRADRPRAAVHRREARRPDHALASTRAPTARSRLYEDDGAQLRLREGRLQRASRCAGTTPRARSPSASARARSPAC